MSRKKRRNGRGMDIKALPRKGFSKNKEEVSGLKLRKNLFVTKPPVEDTRTSPRKVSSQVCSQINTGGS